MHYSEQDLSLEYFKNKIDEFYDINSAKTEDKMIRYRNEVTALLEISTKEAYEGTKKRITFYRYEPCETCLGKFTETGKNAVNCKICNGYGYTNNLEFYRLYCLQCEGEGKIYESPCV